MKFNEPFYGFAYADNDRSSACQTFGKGAQSYQLEIPLKGCGTKQVNSIQKSHFSRCTKMLLPNILGPSTSIYEQYLCTISSQSRNGWR